jgi:twinkle protein
VAIFFIFKTTLLSQLSLDFAEQGINILWGSFEIKNTRLIHKMLQQFARAPLPISSPAELEKLEELADNFQSLPLHFLKFHGGSDIDEVIGAMDYATHVHDVEHVILDNMQFMITRKTQNTSYDKFDTQDMALEKFRKFATEKNIHVTLVVHPRKEDEGAKLGISSIYGSAKATQEADLVLIVQSDGKRKFVEVKKNRYDGTLGYSPLYFDRNSGRYLEQPPGGIPDARPGQVQANSFQPRAAIGTLRSRGGVEGDAELAELSKHWDSVLGP